MANAPAKKSTDVATREQTGQVANAPPAAQAVQGKISLMARIADRYSVDPEKMKATLIATAFRQRPAKEGKESVVVSDEQLMMLLIVADQYKLNPFTKEIYAFPSELGIVPIISVDGWIRIINERPELKSIEFAYSPPTPEGTEADPWISCTIERTDRDKPVEIREYLSECYRDTPSWKSHSRRMLRHKALIQCARVAFGFAGVFDPDEGERIVSVVEQVRPQIAGKPQTRAPNALDAPASATAAEVQHISLGQANALADKLKEEGVALNLLLAKFEIGSLEELPAIHYEAAIAAIDEQSGN